MGCSSSPAITFIMRLFNSRLWVWLGNPGPLGAARYSCSGRCSSAGVFLWETPGQTNAERPYVILWAGGHLENLGICEYGRGRRLRAHDLLVVATVGGASSLPCSP